ncbi:mediator of RNA polymerase II transcription subunit 34-like [Pecten maximus]|uniref:mediator of RNA polymerase II transcription subunit 34-like n=1 Tax=Pecten maximus TaxID=6579 RepID=UPI0014586CC1|nr:mediator of RNA polymerase II transcription subunit 34-like [Pecten maximus]XP_033729301.1 mediator of RNA polymerase II transcription subunit 34-like [Pecten maximus]XP_033730758.1 mediator of RNA polymerase II transcription subunit 34-like [Pecten maximus]XP_033731645.1 mediator of RNA polymerase II transcription subunit 34-like [Pecten maximus]XP_033738911.1 mediator of RNA polymerase II transcription subunit 34-like [Pecten maximus]
MAAFTHCLDFAKEQLGIAFELKEKQIETLKCAYELRDCIAVLPTGYGKSLIFQLLPFFMQKKHGMESPMITLVVTPLNSIMEDQVMSLQRVGIQACFLDYDGKKGTRYTFDTHDSGDEEAEGEDQDQDDTVVAKDVDINDVMKGKYQLVYAHPETLTKSKRVASMLRSKTYQDRTGAIVIDEVHMVTEWGEGFRPAFKELGELTCILPHVAHLALTATSTDLRISTLCGILMYKDPAVVKMNPDRPNIYLCVQSRLPNNRKYEKYDEILKPVITELKQKLEKFPLTIMYVESLEALGYFYRFSSHHLGENQYSPVGSASPENRIIAQYHKDYTKDMKQLIVSELGKDCPKIRLVFATVALGMGLNAPSIERIVHCRPPTTLENYFQEIGRAGRKGQSAEAILHFNNNDLAKSRKGLTQEMIDFCRNNTTCLRRQLVKYFGYDDVLCNDKINCCSNCRWS